ncbi:MAG: UvrD-helicase domain-containing protein [Bacteroidota bacterium]
MNKRLFKLDFLKDLNESQREAVVHVDGPQMVIAGAGSGKTRVLTYRLAFILDQGLADPQELLALTFTNKAAREMKERIFKLVGAPAKSIVMGTFHSIFSRILRVEADRIGYTSAYTIYDSDDQQRMLKTLLKERKMDDKVYKPRVLSNAISMAKNRLISPKEYQENAVDDFNLKVAQIYQAYEERLFKSNAMDFDDLLIKPILLFQGHPDLLYKYQHRFRYIMVDEYQDTNHAQYTLTNMLAAAHHNICVVGDDAQSIYAFRGANIQNILNLKQDYPELKTVKLEQNYRSTKVIVDAANSVIKNNRDQIKKKVFTENEEGEKIALVEAISEQDEAKRVTNFIREQKQIHNFFHYDFAILYRTNAQSRALEDELRRAGLPYKIFGGLSFYQRKEIKDVVAYLKLAINPKDEEAIRRIINYPTRGIGKTSQERINVFAAERGLGLWDALLNLGEAGLKGAINNKIRDFVTMIKDFGVAAERNDAFHAAAYIAKQSGILKDLHGNHKEDSLTRWENVQELLNSAQAFIDDPDNETPALEAFLADISLFTDQDQDPDDNDFVTLMTVHSAKGLEFNSVFLVGMEESLFPSSMAMETRADLEEERRLFYVAVTRAKKKLTMTYARSRYRFGDMQFNEPSRFIDEIDFQYLKRPEQAARRGSTTNGGWDTGRRSAVSPTRRNLKPMSRATVEPGKASDFKAAAPDEIQVGQQVKHQKFGTGHVLALEGAGGGKKATIDFASKGKRVLLLKYAKLQIIE